MAQWLTAWLQCHSIGTNKLCFLDLINIMPLIFSGKVFPNYNVVQLSFSGNTLLPVCDVYISLLLQCRSVRVGIL